MAPGYCTLLPAGLTVSMVGAGGENICINLLSSVYAFNLNCCVKVIIVAKLLMKSL